MPASFMFCTNLNKKKFTIDLPSLSHHTCLMYSLAVCLKTSPIKNSCPWPVFLGNKLFLRDNRQNLCFLPMRNSIWIHLVISSNQLYIIKSVSKLFVHCLKLRHFILLVLTNSVWFWIRFRVTVLIFNFEKKLIALDRERYWFQRHIPSMYISFQLSINFWWCSKWFVILYETCIFKHTFKFFPSNFVLYIETHLLSKNAFKVMVYIYFFLPRHK